MSGTRKYRTKKRSDRIVMTPAARLLKLLRNESGLSMVKAAALMGVSDSYIAHIETGRLDPALNHCEYKQNRLYK